jgi:hypothetical protein
MKAGEVSHVDHGANRGDHDVCLGLVSVGYVHVVLRMSSEIVGALSIDHGWIALG